MAFVRVRNRVTGQQKVLSQGMAHSLRDKYEIISEGVGESVEVSSEAISELSTAPNAEAATEKVAGADDGVELANARAEYEQLFGEKPHGRLKLESIKKLNAEKRG